MIVKLGDVAFENRENWTGSTEGVPIVGLEHLTPGEITLKDWTSDLQESTFTKKFRKGQVLLGRRRVYLRKAALAPFDGICSGDITVIESNPAKLLPELLPFIIQNDEFFEYAMKGSAGSLSPRVKWAHLANYTFNLPSLPEQKRLADLLWAANDLKESYKRLLVASDEMAKSRFVELFGSFNSNPDAVNLETGFTIRDDLRKPINDATRSGMRSGTLYPYYGANGQVDSINEFLMDCEAICLAEDCGSYGAGEATSFIVRGKCWVNNHAHILIPKPNCDIEFANIFFRILDMTEYVTGTTRLKLTQANLKKIQILLPSLERQRAFASFIQQLDKSKVALQKSIERLDNLIKTLLQEHLG